MENEYTEKQLKWQEKRYEYLIDARNHHFTQFNISMAFFITMNGGIYYGYFEMLKLQRDDLILEKILLLLLGYLCAFTFFSCAQGYNYTIRNFMGHIFNHEGKYGAIGCNVYSEISHIDNDDSCFEWQRGAKVSAPIIIGTFAYILTYCWGILVSLELGRRESSQTCLLLICKVLLGIVPVYIVNKILWYFVKKYWKSRIHR